MDFLDHKVGGVRQFQVVEKVNLKPLLKFVPESTDDSERIKSLINKEWNGLVESEVIDLSGLKFSGWRQKFRHVIKEGENI